MSPVSKDHISRMSNEDWSSFVLCPCHDMKRLCKSKFLAFAAASISRASSSCASRPEESPETVRIDGRCAFVIFTMDKSVSMLLAREISYSK